MSDFKEDYLLSRQEYGVLFPYMMKDDVKQIYWNGRCLSIESEQGMMIAKERLSEVFTERFSLLVCNRCGKSLNPEKPVFEYENKALYIQMLHDSIAGAGMTILIRKKEKPTRPDARSLVESGFCDESVIGLLKDIVNEEISFLIYGHRDAKMLMRFMTRYIPPESRMISIKGETALEIQALNPDKDVTEIGIDSERSGHDLIQICRGIRPRWILSGDPDGRVARSIIEAMDMRDIRGGLSIAKPDEEDMLESMFPWEYENRLSRLRQNINRVFPIRIGVDKTGISRIMHYDKQKKEMLYERRPA